MPTFLKVFRRLIPIQINYVSNNVDELSSHLWILEENEQKQCQAGSLA